MHPDQRRLALRDLPFHKRQVMRVIDGRAIHVEIEIPVIGRQFHHLLAHDQLLAQATMRDQTLDRADPQLVFLFELHQLRETCHRAVVVQDFAKHAGRLQPRHPREINRRFSVASPAQDATFLRAQGENVTRLDEVLRL